jgi:hypothetical protein
MLLQQKAAELLNCAHYNGSSRLMDTCSQMSEDSGRYKHQRQQQR